MSDRRCRHKKTYLFLKKRLQLMYKLPIGMLVRLFSNTAGLNLRDRSSGSAREPVDSLRRM